MPVGKLAIGVPGFEPRLFRFPKAALYQTELHPVVVYLIIILLLMVLVKWCPVLPVVFVDCPDTHNRYEDHNVTNESKK